jgi:hypothetical protein
VSIEIKIARSDDVTLLDCVAEGVFDNGIDPRLLVEFLEDQVMFTFYLNAERRQSS